MRFRSPRSYSRAETGELGLTLLELIVAFTLLALLFTVLVASLAFGARTWDASWDKAEFTDEIFIARNIIRRTLSAVRPVPEGNAGDRGVMAFNGRSRAIRFVSKLLHSPSSGGLDIIELLYVGNGETGRLLMRWRSYRSEDTGADFESASTEQRVLLDNIKSVKFSYFGRLRDFDNPVWVDTWINNSSLPSIVSIIVVPAENESGPLPALNVPIRIGSVPGGHVRLIQLEQGRGVL